MPFAIFAILGGLCLLVPTLFYLTGSEPVSIDKFGAFFGSTAGPLLSFLALLAVVATLRNQTEAMKQDAAARVAGEHLRWLDAIYTDLSEMLDGTVIGTEGSMQTLRGFLNSRATPTPPSVSAPQPLIDDFAKLLGQYCEALAIYRENCEPLFDVKIYVDRGARLLDLLKRHIKDQDGMSLIAIEIMDMHLRGENRRTKAEAMSRPTRR